MEQKQQPELNINPEAPKILTGQEGLDLLKKSTAKVEGINLIDFLESSEGQEAIKCKKIILAGPPKSGKSCFKYGIKMAITSISGAPYPYAFNACPDGEGSWFQETMNADPEMAAKLKAQYKSQFSPEFVKRVADGVKNLSDPLNFIDIGGIISPENEKICEGANGAVILSGQTAVENDLPAQWKEFFTDLGIPVVAEIYSDYHGSQDIVEGVGEDGVFRGSVHYLERGELLKDRKTLKAFSEFIVNLGNKEKISDSSLEEIKSKVEGLINSWQEKLPEVEIVLGGSLASGLFVLDDETKFIDVDVRFLTDHDMNDSLVQKIEAVTGLKYRKMITVSDWPEGQSQGMMIEGHIELPDFEKPLDVEGCLRNKKYVGWGKFYKEVLTKEELAEFLEKKKLLRGDKDAYKKLKQEALQLVMSRCIERGLVK